MVNDPVEFMNQSETPEQIAMQREVEAAIERDKSDPRQQNYMFNKTTGLLIRTNHQYHRALENKHEIEVLSYRQAEQVYRREQAARSRALNTKKKRKAAKQARKQSRGS